MNALVLLPSDPTTLVGTAIGTPLPGVGVTRLDTPTEEDSIFDDNGGVWNAGLESREEDVPVITDELLTLREEDVPVITDELLTLREEDVPVITDELLTLGEEDVPVITDELLTLREEDVPVIIEELPTLREEDVPVIIEELLIITEEDVGIVSELLLLSVDEDTKEDIPVADEEEGPAAELTTTPVVVKSSYFTEVM